jgi:hypothetical protein
LFEHLLNGSMYEWLDARAVAENVLMFLRSVELSIAKSPKVPIWHAGSRCLMTATRRGGTRDDVRKA